MPVFETTFPVRVSALARLATNLRPNTTLIEEGAEWAPKRLVSRQRRALPPIDSRDRWRNWRLDRARRIHRGRGRGEGLPPWLGLGLNTSGHGLAPMIEAMLRRELSGVGFKAAELFTSRSVANPNLHRSTEP